MKACMGKNNQARQSLRTFWDRHSGDMSPICVAELVWDTRV